MRIPLKDKYGRTYWQEVEVDEKSQLTLLGQNNQREENTMRVSTAADKTYTVELTLDEIRGVRSGLIFGVPDPTPDEIETATAKLGRAQRQAEAEGD